MSVLAVQCLMTKAKHFFMDYPNKCKSMLEENFAEDQNKDREVTHMLALASGIIVVPYERLGVGGFSLDDQLYPESAKKLCGCLEAKYNDSHLFQHMQGKWFYDQWDGESYYWEAKSGTENRQSIEAYQAKPGNQPLQFSK